MLQSSSSRRATFAAAMEQFEELMRAAASVGPASRAVPLYYATAQGGLAVAAAHKSDPWSFDQHGIKVVDARQRIGDISIAPQKVARQKAGAFQTVATATGSPVLDKPTRLEALWASLPQLSDVTLPESEAPPALDVVEASEPYVPPAFRDPTPWSSTEDGQSGFCATVYVNGEPPGQERFAAVLAELLDSYPGAAGCEVLRDDTCYREIRRNRWGADVYWPEDVVLRRCTRGDDFLAHVAPPYRHEANHYLRPSVEGGGIPAPSPLMTWWAILYAFSVLTRYYPREWTNALNIDRSEAATPLEYALDLAMETIPHLMAEALDGEPLFLLQTLRL